MADLGMVGVGPRPVPTIAAFRVPLIPAIYLSVIIANYGQAGGAVSIF